MSFPAWVRSCRMRRLTRYSPMLMSMPAARSTTRVCTFRRGGNQGCRPAASTDEQQSAACMRHSLSVPVLAAICSMHAPFPAHVVSGWLTPSVNHVIHPVGAVTMLYPLRAACKHTTCSVMLWILLVALQNCAQPNSFLSRFGIRLLLQILCAWSCLHECQRIDGLAGVACVGERLLRGGSCRGEELEVAATQKRKCILPLATVNGRQEFVPAASLLVYQFGFQ